jgi:tetratricopeptide (TPR) repeat protein
VTTICAGRERELNQIKARLKQAISGNFQICFVVGEAGSGKTTLLNAFAENAQMEYPDLLIAIGECNSRTGISDPYLPFKEILAMLVGDIDAKSARGRISPQTSKRLRNAMATSIETILEIGPELIGSLIPGGGLVAKAIQVFTEKSEVLKKLRLKVDNPINPEIGQLTIFQEYTKVLLALSQKHPFLLVLDDLHWIDSSSASLLFHLARKLTSSRVMIIGTYRPNEIHTPLVGRTRHPMETIINELKRYFGDIEIEIDFTSTLEEKSQSFIDSIVNIEPNSLTRDFRTKLNLLTEGNALFATEILRNLKEKGHLVLDARGKWTITARMDWNTIPTKVEGVIEERIERLEDELKTDLAIASVEGESFTAQVIGRLQELSERHILHDLKDELEKQHRLVTESGETKVGTRYLSIFHFNHSLIHQFLYSTLGQSERRILHKQVAETLELLYKDHLQPIFLQLARHYEEAGDIEKATNYLIESAKSSLRISAFRESRISLEKALSLGTAETATLITINLYLGMVLFGMGDYPSGASYLENCLLQTQISNDLTAMASCKLWLSKIYCETGKIELSEKYARDCIELASSLKQDDLTIKGYSQLSYVLYTIGQVTQAKRLLERSLELENKVAPKFGYIWKAQTLYTLGCCQIVMNDLLAAEAVFLEDIKVAQAFGNREIESYSTTDLGFVVYEKGEYDRARDLFEQGFKLGTEIDAQWTIAESFCGLGFVNASLGNYAKSKVQLQSALKVFNSTHTFTGLLLTIVGFSLLLSKQDRDIEALQLIGLSRKYVTPIADTDHFADLVLREIRLRVTEDLIQQELNTGKSLDLTGVVTKLLSA